jgi:hypothetical protein
MATRQSSTTATRRPPQSRKPEDGRRLQPEPCQAPNAKPAPARPLLLSILACSPDQQSDNERDREADQDTDNNDRDDIHGTTVPECGMREPGRQKVLAARLTAAPRSPGRREVDLKTGR